MMPKSFARAQEFLDRQLSSPVFSSQQIYKMMLPFILDSLSIMFINMLITALISSSGEDSIAAVNLVSPIFLLVMCLLNGISAGGTVAVTQSYGSGDIESTRTSAGITLWLTFLVGASVCSFLMIFAEPILRFLYQQAEVQVMDKAIHYMTGGSFSLIIFSLYSAVFSILRGLGESQKCLCLSIIINVAYLLFSILFLNILKMDIQGSALAQILARAVGASCALAFLFLAKKIPITMTIRDVFSFRKSIFSSILDVSIPFGVEQIFLYGGNIVITSMMVPLGTTAVAINSIASSLFGVVTSAAQAAGSLGTTVVGRCIGADEKEHAYRYGYKMCILALTLLIISSAILFPVFPMMLRYLYNASDAVQAGVIHLLHAILIPALLFWPVSNIMPYIFRAAHDTLFPSVLSMASMWGVRIGLAYLLAFPFGLGLNGLWIGMWAEWAVRTLALLIRFLRKKWFRTVVAAENNRQN